MTARAERVCSYCGTAFRPKSSRKTECCSHECAMAVGRMTRFPKDLDRSFMAHAACVGKDPDIFFPERGDTNAEAVAVCRRCPVRFECLEYALQAGEKYGVWGGLSERQRRKIRQQRRRAAAA